MSCLTQAEVYQSRDICQCRDFVRETMSVLPGAG